MISCSKNVLVDWQRVLLLSCDSAEKGGLFEASINSGNSLANDITRIMEVRTQNSFI